MNDWKERVTQELSELQERLRKLNAFLETPQSYELDSYARQLLVHQSLAMTNYADILQTRLVFEETKTAVDAIDPPKMEPMPENTHLCPRRQEVFQAARFGAPEFDCWTERDTCSWCGSLHPDLFMERVRAGDQLGPTDKNYKVYIGSTEKFYFQHLSEEQMKELIDLLNARKLNIGYPGHFYRLPYFMRVNDPPKSP